MNELPHYEYRSKGSPALDVVKITVKTSSSPGTVVFTGEEFTDIAFDHLLDNLAALSPKDLKGHERFPELLSTLKQLDQ